MADNSIRPSVSHPKINPELTLSGLRVFIALEETGTIGGAARRIGGSPSGVSQRITALEQAIGAKLFDRRARPIVLTPAGQVLRLHAHRILEAASDAQAELAELNLAVLPQLSLAIIDDLDASLTPTLVLSLRKRFRHCFVNACSGRSDWVTAKLERREADIAVSAIVPDDSNSFHSSPILRESLILAAAKGALAADQDLRDQLAKLPFVQYSDAMPIGRVVAQHLKRVRFTVPRRFAFEASRSVFAMVVQARGWTLTTPLNLLDAERFVPNMDVLPMPFPALSRWVHLIARSDELGHLPGQLADDCRDILASEIVPRFTAIAPEMTGVIEVVAE